MTWQKVADNGGRLNGVAPDPAQSARALAWADYAGHHTTENGAQVWIPRMKGIHVTSSGVANSPYGRTGCWSEKHPGRCYTGIGGLKTPGGALNKIDLTAADPWVQTQLASAYGFGTNMLSPAPNKNNPAGNMPRGGCGQLIDTYYAGSGAEYIFAATATALIRLTDEASPVELVSGTFDGGAANQPPWKALICAVESGSPVVYASTYGLGGYTGSKTYRITNPIGSSVSSLLGAAPSGVNDYAALGTDLYAVAGSTIYKVTAAGATWTSINDSKTSGRTLGSIAAAVRGSMTTLLVLTADSNAAGQNLLEGTLSGGTWTWRWIPATGYMNQRYGLPAGSTYYLNAAKNRLFLSMFQGASVRFDANPNTVYICGTNGMFVTPDYFAHVYPAGYGLGGSESHSMTHTSGTSFAVSDTDWVSIHTTDEWASMAAGKFDAYAAPSGGSLSTTVGSDTYVLTASTPATITKNGTPFHDNYFQAACIGPDSIAADSNGVVCVALNAGGVLRFTPGGPPPPPPDQPPAFSGVPTISGTLPPTVGASLIADPGAVTGSPVPTPTYQWQSQ